MLVLNLANMELYYEQIADEVAGESGTYCCRPADADFVPSPFLKLQEVPRLQTVGRGLTRKLHGKLGGQNCLRMRQGM
jgi:hypothetical protein